MKAARFEIGLAVSVVINGAAWIWAAGAAEYKLIPPPRPLEFERVVITKDRKIVPKVVKRVVPAKPVPVVKPVSRPVLKPPETAHNRVVVAPLKQGAAPKTDFSVPAGGNAKVGVPTSGQGTGNAVVNPPARVPVEQPPVETPKPVETQPVAPAPAPVTQPKPEPTPAPAPVEAPKPKGETRDAVPSHQVSVEIPEDLKSQSFKSFVRVRVTISADGSFTVTLRSGSGNSEVDKLVTDALNQWKWKPALKDGEPVDSVQAFRFDFEIQ